MKGWIKVHEASERELYLRAEDIYSVEDYLEDEKEGFETHEYTLINDSHYVTETVEEVLALIEKAEKPEKKSLYKELERTKAECERAMNAVNYGFCDICKAKKFCSYFNKDLAIDWDLDKIPEEYR